MKKYDDMAWQAIHRRRRPPNSGNKELGRNGRSANYVELTHEMEHGGDWELVWSDFLHEFYLFKSADFFEEEPGDWFSHEMRAWMAGVAEFLSHRFNLPVPEWTNRPEFFLDEWWQKSRDSSEDAEFTRRNVGYNPRHLIRL